MYNLSAEDVKALREKTGMSMKDAKNYIRLKHEKKYIEKLISDNDSLVAKINFLLERELEKVETQLENKFCYIDQNDT